MTTSKVKQLERERPWNKEKGKELGNTTLFEGKTLFNKLWPLLDLRAELDFRLTNNVRAQES